jgi:hypothetical protein
MAITSYCTLDEARSTAGIPDNTDDATLSSCVSTASRRIDSYCGRVFYLPDAVSDQKYVPNGDLISVDTDDIATTAGLVVATSVDNTNWTTLSTYELEPTDGIGPNGQTGWPYSRIRLVDSWFYWPFPYGYQKTVRVTAKYGWLAVPSDVNMACRLLTNQIFRAKDAPFGATGFDGNIISVRANPLIANLLDPFRMGGAMAGMA